MEAALSRALKAEGWTVVRAHPYDKEKQHGFIDSQKMGIDVFRCLDPDAPVIVAESVWQYSHHVLAGLWTHRGPDSDCGQLERHLARAGRHAQPERVAHQGRHPLQHTLE